MLWLTLLAACGAWTCEELDAEASAVVDAAIAQHQECAVDEDCAIVWRSGACFAHCSAIVGVGGVEAVDAVLIEAEAICADQPSCVAVEPPCAPPGVLRCDGGVCVEA